MVWVKTLDERIDKIRLFYPQPAPATSAALFIPLADPRSRLRQI
jgi:hypothetical protein